MWMGFLFPATLQSSMVKCDVMASPRVLVKLQRQLWHRMRRGRAGRGSWKLNTQNKLNLSGCLVGAEMKNQCKGGFEKGVVRMCLCKGLDLGRAHVIPLADQHGLTSKSSQGATPGRGLRQRGGREGGCARAGWSRNSLSLLLPALIPADSVILQGLCFPCKKLEGVWGRSGLRIWQNVGHFAHLSHSILLTAFSNWHYL